MFSKKYLLISTIIIAFFAWVQIVAAATWPTHDEILPTSSFNIPIETVNSQRVDDMCMEWNLSYAIYSWAELSYKVYSAPKSQHQIFTKSSRAYVYGQMPAGLTFPIVSNFIPKNGTPSIGSKIYIYQNEWGTFVGNTEVERWEISTQISIMAVFRSLNPLSTIRTPYQYFYVKTAGAAPITFSDSTFKDNFIYPTDQPLYGCNNYYIAYCGDGKIDKKNGDETTDGQWWIDPNDNDIWFLTWNIAPAVDEVCDDGELNGTPWHCKLDCTGLEWPAVNTGGATCTLTASASSIESGQSVTITAWYTSWENATLTPNISGLTSFTYPTRNGTATDTPATTTTYTLHVEWSGDLENATCTTTVAVVEPEPHLECTLTLSPSISGTGQVVNVWWNVSNGNFHSTYIFVNPSAIGARPHLVHANTFNWVTTVTPTTTGEYIFTMNVSNEDEQATCTGILNVVEPVGPCTLTTNTPIIYPGQTGNLNASYFNANVATFTPGIDWLNLVYPHRSNSGIVVQPSDTTTYVLDVLGVNWSTESCSATIMVMNTGLQLSKSLIANTLYHSGDLVTFKINFANNWVNVIDNVILSDYLPASLEYINSQLYGVTPPYTFGTGNLGNNAFVEYSGFSLAPGQHGYMLVMGRFKWYAYSNQTLNNAFIKWDNTPLVYASALFHAYSPTSNATAIKTSNKTSYIPGESAQFTVAVTNNGPDAINSMTITDNRPGGSCVTLDSARSSNMPLTVANTSNPYSWTFNGTLWVGQTIYLYLTGHIANDFACIGNYVNNANITYVTHGSTYTGNALPLNFSVSATPSSTLLFEKRLVSYGTNPWDPVVFELLYRNNWSATIANYDIIDYRPGTLHFVSASPMPTTQTMGTGWVELRWLMHSSLAPNGSGKIIINGTIK